MQGERSMMMQDVTMILGTPRGRFFDEHNNKFPSVVNPRLNRTSRRKPKFRR
jgi:hypothetical protein